MDVIIHFNDKQEPYIIGGELHEALGVQMEYKEWFLRMCKNGFIKGKDFNPLKIKQVQMEFGHEVVLCEYMDNWLSCKMARKICSIQRTKRGKMCRKCILKLERFWKKNQELIKQTGRSIQMRVPT